MGKFMYFNIEIDKVQAALDWYDDEYTRKGREKPNIVPCDDYGILMLERRGGHTSEWVIWIDGKTEFFGHIVPLEADVEFNENDKGMLAAMPDMVGPFATEDEAYKETTKVIYTISFETAFNLVK